MAESAERGRYTRTLPLCAFRWRKALCHFALAQLIEDDAIVRPIYDDIVRRDIEQRDDLRWSLLLFSGYLKCSAQPMYRNWYELRVPNEEVKQVYQALIERWFAKKVTLMQLESLLSALEGGDIRLFERVLRQIIKEIMSYHDLAGEPEKVYQALVLGLLVWLSDKYEIRTNRESGYGRYDMMFKPKDPTGMKFTLLFPSQLRKRLMHEQL